MTLGNGEQLRLDRRGDLGAAHGGMLIFLDGSQRPEYVLWSDVERIEFTPAAAPRSVAPAAPGAQVRRTQALPPPP